MADMDSRTEEATPRKREEARDEGRIPRSQELTTAVLFLAAAGILRGLGPALAEGVGSAVTYGMMSAASSTLDEQGAVAFVRQMGWKLLAATAAFLLATSGAALGISAVQARGVLSMKPLEPKWERLNPVANAKNLIGIKSVVELVKSLFKLFVIGLMVSFALRNAWGDSLALSQQSPRQLVTVLHEYSVRLLLTVGAAYLVLALADYLYQLWQHEKDLRMSKQEVKQEHRESEGDPMLKARMRSMGRALARRQMFQEVPRADVVVTNPTHIAVALRYDPEVADAPIVVAMGQRKVAERIKRIARESGVPTLENKPLARALLANARVGMTIPSDLYVAVAEILAFVFSKRRPGRRDSGAA
ncbi:MAG TPA: flagellar biosynthesis protein FlhB [Longimicrobiaceae bacterium]